MARSIATALELDIGDRTLGYTLHRIVGRKHVHLVVDQDARLQVRAPWAGTSFSLGFLRKRRGKVSREGC